MQSTAWSIKLAAVRRQLMSCCMKRSRNPAGGAAQSTGRDKQRGAVGLAAVRHRLSQHTTQ